MNTSFISTQQIKDLINEQKFTSTQEIMDCMKGMFADVLEQTLQAEMDQHLGYEHAERRNDDAKKNYRNGTVKRTMKTQLGEVEINVPRDRNGEFEPKIISKYQLGLCFYYLPWNKYLYIFNCLVIPKEVCICTRRNFSCKKLMGRIQFI